MVFRYVFKSKIGSPEGVKQNLFGGGGRKLFLVINDRFDGPAFAVCQYSGWDSMSKVISGNLIVKNYFISLIVSDDDPIGASAAAGPGEKDILRLVRIEGQYFLDYRS